METVRLLFVTIDVSKLFTVLSLSSIFFPFLQHLPKTVFQKKLSKNLDAILLLHLGSGSNQFFLKIVETYLVNFCGTIFTIMFFAWLTIHYLAHSLHFERSIAISRNNLALF